MYNDERAKRKKTRLKRALALRTAIDIEFSLCYNEIHIFLSLFFHMNTISTARPFFSSLSLSRFHIRCRTLFCSLFRSRCMCLDVHVRFSPVNSIEFGAQKMHSSVFTCMHIV